MCRNPIFAEQWLDHTKPQQPKFIGAAKNYTIEMKRQLEEVVRRHGKKLLIINCGQCIDCKLQKSREWATRCMLETKEHQNNYFITLTYNDENLPKKQIANLETGELTNQYVATLKQKDLQDFWKRLREHYTRKYHISPRYFACGEYGEKFSRPHYHAILFNCPINDLKPDHKSKRGNMNYTSAELEKIWGKGFVAVGNVTWESCAYTARYITKKQTGKGKITYWLKQVEPEFCRMSKRPAIGKKYFEENWEKIYENDELFTKTKNGVTAVKPSRYYDKLFDVINHEKMQNIKRDRVEIAEIRQKQLENSSDKSWEELVKDAEESRDKKLKSLRRNFEKLL